MSSSGQERVLPTPATEATLLIWLLDALRPMNRTRVKQLLKSGRVLVNDAPTTRHDHPLQPGDRIAITRESAPISRDHDLKRDGITVIYEDQELLVIDKPPGLLTVATESEKLDTAFALLNARLTLKKAGRPFVVHRLDRETSGLVIFARSEESRDRLQAKWETVTKTYLAVVEGKPQEDRGTVDNFLSEGRDLRVRISNPPRANAKRAISRYRVVATRADYSLVEVVLETGRKHQIRVHMAGLGCPVVGDAIYGATTNPAGRLGLHSWRLSFDQPFTGKRLELESPFPSKLERLVGSPTNRTE